MIFHGGVVRADSLMFTGRCAALPEKGHNPFQVLFANRRYFP